MKKNLEDNKDTFLTGEPITLVDSLPFILPLIYIIFVSLYMLWYKTWFSTYQVLAFMLIGFLFIRKIRQKIWDWVPVLMMVFGYGYLRGILPTLSETAHIYPMIYIDRLLFGFIPTIRLQSLFFFSQQPHWYDYLFIIIYMSHYIIPLYIAYRIKQFNQVYFKEYVTAFLILAYISFITYILFPAMPPWMASSFGYIPPVTKIMDHVLASTTNPISVPSIYQFLGANLVAAFPSVHAAFPWLIFLFVWKKSKKLGFLTLPYVLSIWFAVIYLGEHYVIDVIAGVIYASFSYSMTYWIKKKNRTLFFSPKHQF